MKKSSLIFSLVCASLLVFISCNSSKEEGTIAELEEAKPDTFILSKTQFTLGEMEISSLQVKDFHESVSCNGFFDVPPEKRASISVYFGGYVSTFNLNEGQKIQQGELLFSLENPEFIKVQEAFLIAQSKLAYLKSDYERQLALSQENIASQKNYLLANSEYLSTLSTYEALKKTLELMHINTNTLTYSNIQTSIPVLSPCDGYLSQVKLSPGMFLNPSDVALSVVNTDHLHLELQVFESDLTKLKVGQAVSFNQSGSEDDWQEGEIYLISKTIDPDTRSTLVHVHFNNKEFNYLPGMFAKAKIYTATKTSLSLPESAIVKIDKEYYVLQVLRNEDEEIVLEKKPILVGAQENGYFEILNTSDFEKESFFLTKGAFQIIRE